MGDVSGVRPSRIDALDGLRALAVTAVMFFHLNFDWMAGGFLGVSLFFTLSGFLITRLLLQEKELSGRVSLRAFWARRLRRLSPAALVVLAAVVVSSMVGLFEGPRVRGDIGASLGYVANWRFATAESTYAELFTSMPSPVIHFWSLAIEEQFYLVFPLLFVVLSKRRRLLSTGLVMLVVTSVLASFFTDSRNLGYYGTHLRAAELLMGCMLAVILDGKGDSSSPKTGRTIANGVGPVSLVIMGTAMVVSSPSDAWLYRGGFAAIAVVSVGVILGATRGGPLSWLFSRRPLVAIGRASYSIYLVHWPVIVAMTPDRMGFDGWMLDASRILISSILGFASHRFIENPVRTKRILKGATVSAVALIATMAAVAASALAIDSSRETSLAGLDAPDEVVDFAAVDMETSSSTTIASPQTRVLVVGSQLRTAVDLSRANVALDVVDVSSPGCAFRADVVRDCPTVDDALAAVIRESPDVVVVGVGLIERRIVRERVATDASLVGVDPVVAQLAKSGGVVDEMLLPLDGRPVIVVDFGPEDAFRAALEDYDLRSDSTVLAVGGRPEELGTTIDEIVNDLRADLVRVMVIGDSSSFGVAQALHNVASDRFEVVWAGGRNCPLVEVERIQWWPDMDFDMSYCPTFDGVWRDMIAEFAPNLVIEIASVPEQSAQRYPGDPEWYIVDDEEFVRRHDEVVADLMAALGEVGATLVMFDSPYVYGGGLGGAVFADDVRVDAWNALMKTWITRWPTIRPLEWSTIVAEAEETPGELRVDGVHMEQPVLDRIVAEKVVPALTDILSDIAIGDDGQSPSTNP